LENGLDNPAEDGTGNHESDVIDHFDGKMRE
jgi:hypothetical protein